MENNNDNKKRSSLYTLIIVGLCITTLNYMLASSVEKVGQLNTKENTETAEEVTEEVEEINKVYGDLSIEDTHKLTISDDETYFSYKAFYEEDVLNLVSKIELSTDYEVINITREGSYTYIIFKYIGS